MIIEKSDVIIKECKYCIDDNFKKERLTMQAWSPFDLGQAVCSKCGRVYKFVRKNEINNIINDN